MDDNKIKYIAKTLSTIVLWTIIMHILTINDVSGGTIGWALFFGIIGTAIVWRVYRNAN